MIISLYHSMIFHTKTLPVETAYRYPIIYELCGIHEYYSLQIVLDAERKKSCLFLTACFFEIT